MPARRTSPARPAGPGPVADPPARPGGLAGPESQPSRGLAGRGLQVARTPFVLLVLALLGGGLICLLVINTTLATSAFRINDLRQQIVSQSRQEQALQEQVATEESPATIQKEARRLGMRQQQRLNFINARTGRIYRWKATEPGVAAVPGYTP